MKKIQILMAIAAVFSASINHAQITQTTLQVALQDSISGPGDIDGEMEIWLPDGVQGWSGHSVSFAVVDFLRYFVYENGVLESSVNENHKNTEYREESYVLHLISHKNRGLTIRVADRHFELSDGSASALSHYISISQGEEEMCDFFMLFGDIYNPNFTYPSCEGGFDDIWQHSKSERGDDVCRTETVTSREQESSSYSFEKISWGCGFDLRKLNTKLLQNGIELQHLLSSAHHIWIE